MSGLTMERQVTGRFALPYGQGALALYAAPNLLYPITTTPEPHVMAAYIHEGLSALGGLERLQALHEEVLEVNRQLLRRTLDPDDYEAEMFSLLQCGVPAMRPNPERLRWCESYDWERLRFP